MMNFNNVFRWHLPFLFLVLLTFRAAAADTLLILGDSLSRVSNVCQRGLACLVE